MKKTESRIYKNRKKNAHKKQLLISFVSFPFLFCRFPFCHAYNSIAYPVHTQYILKHDETSSLFDISLSNCRLLNLPNEKERRKNVIHEIAAFENGIGIGKGWVSYLEHFCKCYMAKICECASTEWQRMPLPIETHQIHYYIISFTHNSIYT